MPRKFRPVRGIVIVSMLVSSLAGCSALSPPLEEPQVEAFAARLGDDLIAAGSKVTGVLSADEAVARAVAFNRAIKAKELEAMFSAARAQALNGAMLPAIVGQREYYRRDRPSLSHSNQSAGYSTSTDIATISRDITLSWNILDFGLSYVRSRQALDRAYQQHEEVRRVTLRIVEETRSHFWRAAALEMLGAALPGLDREIEQALALSRKAGADTDLDPMLSINFQRDALNLQREINQLQTSLAGATGQLKQSIGAPSAGSLRLEPYRRSKPVSVVSLTADADAAAALRQRPEIRAHMYDMRITADEINAAVLQALPGVTLGKSWAADSNSFLLHANWISWSTKIAGNLINLIRLPAEIETIEAQQRAHRQNALATAAAIVMQVHVARARIAVQARAHRDAERFASVQRRLLRQTRVSVQLGKVGQQVIVREKLATLLAEARAIIAFGDLSAAHSAYAAAKGEAPLSKPWTIAKAPVHQPPATVPH